MKTKQTIPQEMRYTVATFNEEFPNDDACLEYIKEQRWPDGVTQCEKCGVECKHHRVTGRTAYACQACGNHIYPLAGTVFEKSTTSLKLWFYAMYLMGSTRCGISAKQIQRETGVTYKTAWRMFRQIRSLLSEDGLQLEGSTVEMDEMYHGGKRQRIGQRGRPSYGSHKVPVIGMVDLKRRLNRLIHDCQECTPRYRLHPLSRLFSWFLRLFLTHRRECITMPDVPEKLRSAILDLWRLCKSYQLTIEAQSFALDMMLSFPPEARSAWTAEKVQRVIQEKKQQLQENDALSVDAVDQAIRNDSDLLTHLQTFLLAQPTKR